MRMGLGLWLVLTASAAADTQCDVRPVDSLSMVQVEVGILVPGNMSHPSHKQPPRRITPAGSNPHVRKWIHIGSSSKHGGQARVRAAHDPHRIPKVHHSFIALGVFVGLSALSVMSYCWSFTRAADRVKDEEHRAEHRAKAARKESEEDPGSATASSESSAQAPSSMSRIRSDPSMDQMPPSSGGSIFAPGEGGMSTKRQRYLTLPSSFRLMWHKKKVDKEDHCQQMTFWQFVFTIVADLCPSGFLSLAFGLGGVGYFWALVIMATFLLLATFTMWTVGKVSDGTRCNNFTSQWIAAVGNGGHWIPMVIVLIVSYGALVCYACYFGDLLEEALPAFGFALPRFMCIICFSLFPAFPLCLLKDFSALSAASTFAFLSMLYTTTIMLVRTFDGSYILGGVFYMDAMPSLRSNPMRDKHIFNFSSSRSLIYINILAMAFHCHCNAPKYYRELENNTPTHFSKATLVAMLTAGTIYALTAFAGYRTFGSACDGTILMNYSPEDWPVNIARILLSLSLVASYAIMFAAFREAFIAGLQEILGEKFGLTFTYVWEQDIITVVLVCLVTICSVVCADSGTVDGFIGAFCGNAIIYIIPCIIFLFATRPTNARPIERKRWTFILSIILVILGVALAIAGSLSLGFYEFEGEADRHVGHSGKGVVIKGVPTLEDDDWGKKR